MDKLIPTLYREYGKYINTSRAIPLATDGLKPVERRVLYSSYQIARERFVKSVRVDGHCLGHYHAHGSSYGSIVQMVKQGFLDPQGNFGSTLGTETSSPAAPRYTECKLSDLSKKLAFQFIDHVPYVLSDLGIKEPVFLPSMFPLCLLGTEYTFGIGFAYRTYIPHFRIEDLYKRLLWLLGKVKEKPTIKPLTNCNILSSDEEIETLLTKGKATIDVQGKIIRNNASYEVIVKSWPDNKTWISVLSKLKEFLDTGDMGYQDLSSMDLGTHVVFGVQKLRNRPEIFQKFIPKLQESLKGRISFDIIMVREDGNLATMSVDELLLDSFKMFESVNKTMLETGMKKVLEDMEEYKVLEKIKPILPKYITTKVTDVPSTIKKISTEASVPEEIIQKLLKKYRIHKLLSLDTDISELQKNLDLHKDLLANTKKFVLRQYHVWKGE